MSGVDSRIVTMKFDNVGFEKNARTTMSTLSKLKESLNFGNVAKAAYSHLGGITSALSKVGLKNPFAQSQRGIQELSGEAGRFNLNSMEGAVTGISKSWLALTTVALTALSNITSRAVSAGTTWIKSFTFGPIMDGLHEYQTNLQSIQTIQANTDQPLTKINKSLNELNHYSDLTIYNFSQMAENIGTFTAAGVDLKTATSSIKGIANLAALSGSSAQQAATAMYQLSQAISSGRVGLQDWNSVVNAGMGGKKLQNALAQTAVAMGQLDANAVKMVGPMKNLKISGQSFRESISAGPGKQAWLTSDVLVNTLATLDGRFSRAALSAARNADGTRKYNTQAKITNEITKARLALEKKNGVKYTDQQFKALQKMSDSAFHAATQVKTLGQVFDVAKESIGSGWGQSFKSIFGGLGEAKTLFTDMSNSINGFISRNALARNNLLAIWKKKGGRAELIDGLKLAFKGLASVFKPIQQGFREIFPKKTASDLLSLTHSFHNFAQGLKVSGDTADKIKRTFAGVFAIFSIIGKVILGVSSGFGRLFSSMRSDNGGFLNFTAGLGDSIVAFNNFLDKSQILTKFFNSFNKILSLPIKLLLGFTHILGGLFGSVDSSKATAAVDKFGKALSPLQALGQVLMTIFKRVADIFSNVGNAIGNALGGLGTALAHSITPETFKASLDVINTSLLGGIVLMLRQFMSGGLLKVDLGGGIFSGIRKTLGEATGVLQDMQAKIKAEIILKIATALAILTASLYVLSTIDDKKLAKAFAAMGLGFGVLVGAMASLIKVLGSVGVVQIYILAGAMTKLATSMLLLAAALKIMASIPFWEMVKGLAGLAAMLFIVQKALIPMAAQSKGMGKVTGSLILLGIALNIMAVALKIFATLSWDQMVRGLTALAGMLAVISIAMQSMPRNMVAQAGALLILSAALNGMAVALKIFGTIKWDAMVRGLTAVAGMLSIISIALNLMPKDMAFKAAALLAVSVALNIMAGALKIMGSMGWDAIGKGMVVLAGSLTILAVALSLMGGTAILGAAALLVAAGALAILAPILVTLGALSWESIIKGLTALAGTFIILGVAGLLLGPLVPVLLGLGVALTLIGAGLALAGAGALLFGTAFGIIVATGTAGIQLLGTMMGTIIATIPIAMGAIGKGMVEFVKAIATGGPAFVAAMSKVISNMLDAVIKNVPKFGHMLLVMVNTGVRVIGSAVPKFINLGFRLIIAFLSAISKNIGRITDIAASIIVKFLNGIGRNIGRIIQAGVNLIIKFVNGVSRAIDRNSTELGKAGGRLGLAMVKGMAKGISGAASVIKDAALGAARRAFDAVKHFFGINSPSKLMENEVGAHLPTGMALGIDKSAHIPVRSIEDMGKNALVTMKKTMSGVSDALRLEGTMDPVISPVLDLTALTKEANKMSGILKTVPVITPEVSFRQAASVVASTQPKDDGSADDTSTGSKGGGDIIFQQTLNSPKALDPVTHYRQTKNLISIAKEALK